jgi:hypothetical protein
MWCVFINPLGLDKFFDVVIVGITTQASHSQKSFR